jgi:hypothetical protein
VTTSVIEARRTATLDAANAQVASDTVAIESAGSTDRSIVVIGDDPLMVRALDRLLRKAGYVVGIRDRDLNEPGDPLFLDAGAAALTIVDVPDAWTRRGRPLLELDVFRSERSDPILWLSNASYGVGPPERCLIKPFTASQFLAKVEALLNQRPTTR